MSTTKARKKWLEKQARLYRKPGPTFLKRVRSLRAYARKMKGAQWGLIEQYLDWTERAVKGEFS